MFHKNHVVRFLEAAKLHGAREKEILKRADLAINEFGDESMAVFPGRRIDEVLGDAELADNFRTMWNKGDLYC